MHAESTRGAHVPANIQASISMPCSMGMSSGGAAARRSGAPVTARQKEVVSNVAAQRSKRRRRGRRAGGGCLDGARERELAKEATQEIQVLRVIIQPHSLLIVVV